MASFVSPDSGTRGVAGAQHPVVSRLVAGQRSYALAAMAAGPRVSYFPGIEKRDTRRLLAKGASTGLKMNIARSLRTWRSYRAAMSELSRLSPRELADLGISRADIPAVARRSGV